ncbi:hypothetical protein HY384_04535 [Candidatus Daviesbacteria bacterium]|nr:hypothetical protein [Candidatus Daviesbacteria bacterium]
MQDLLNSILKDTYSISELKHRLRILKNYLSESFFGGQKVELTGVEDTNWLKSLPAQFFQSINKDNIYNIFTNLEADVKKLTILTMYLTFEPDTTTISQIGTFARKNFGPSLLLDIKFDPNLIAGTALVWKGNYQDYSLRSKMAQKKEEILESFKKFLR